MYPGVAAVTARLRRRIMVQLVVRDGGASDPGAAVMEELLRRVLLRSVHLFFAGVLVWLQSVDLVRLLGASPELLRPIFLLLVRGPVERILWGIRFLGWSLLVLFLELGSFFSFLLLHLCMQVAGQVEVSGVAESNGPTADGPLSRMCCSLPMFGVRPSVRGDDGGGVRLVCVIWRADGDRLPTRIGKIYSSSRDLLVIFLSLGVLSAKEGCIIPSFSV
ncbi:hypothetical protein C2845_PM15G06550 [Panicum miliaceum]|uniref:Uncharacterized protein n=1 Tax=Panicum miliaceum TaxID=4540 RepID=A0A3L6Q814_PANMI|nr:hypothetical protein C2845_PM15G06550 [Panicum miliaceum]